jgi:hypothetical protein
VRWQRGARIGLAVVGISFAVALWAFRREPPVEPPVLTLKPTDSTAAAEGGAVTRNLFEGSKTKARWRVESWASYNNPDRMIGTNNYMLFEAEGLEIWSDEAEVLGVATATTPREVKFAGHVRFRTKDGLEVTAPSATYDSTTEVILMPGPVRFTKGRMTGDGSG